MPIESAAGWKKIFGKLQERGVQRIGLVVADGIKGLDTVVGECFPGTPLQRCVSHLKRNIYAKVRHGTRLLSRQTYATSFAQDNVIIP